jgi:hypothetical protein
MSRQFYSVHEVCAELGMEKSTLRRYLRRLQVEPVRLKANRGHRLGGGKGIHTVLCQWQIDLVRQAWKPRE